MAQSLTLVLPVHNAEATLPRQVEDLLNIAGELTSQFELLVIDDGSKDDTYEIASELATQFPQIRVTRHAHHRGLGPTLRSLRGRVTTDVVIVCDSSVAFNAEQVRRLWVERVGSQLRLDEGSAAGLTTTYLEELRAPARVQPAMAAAHRRLGRLELLPEGDRKVIAAESKPVSQTPSDPTRRLRRSGVGQVPILPAPNFLDTLATFAIGE